MISDQERYQKIYEYREKLINHNEEDLEKQIKHINCDLHMRAFFRACITANKILDRDTFVLFAMKELISTDEKLATAAATFLLECCGDKGSNALGYAIHYFDVTQKHVMKTLLKCDEYNKELIESKGQLGRTADSHRFYGFEIENEKLTKIWIKFPYANDLIKPFFVKYDEESGEIDILVYKPCENVVHGAYYGDEYYMNLLFQDKKEKIGQDLGEIWTKEIENMAAIVLS